MKFVIICFCKCVVNVICEKFERRVRYSIILDAKLCHFVNKWFDFSIVRNSCSAVVTLGLQRILTWYWVRLNISTHYIILYLVSFVIWFGIDSKGGFTLNHFCLQKRNYPIKSQCRFMKKHFCWFYFQPQILLWIKPNWMSKHITTLRCAIEFFKDIRMISILLLHLF